MKLGFYKIRENRGFHPIYMNSTGLTTM